MTDPSRAKNLHRYGDGDAAKSALDSVIPAITITVKFSKCRKVGVGGRFLRQNIFGMLLRVGLCFCEKSHSEYFGHFC